MTTRIATCACGQLRAECDGDPRNVWLCHCTQCQKRPGSTYGANAYFARSQVKVAGAAKRSVRSSDSGRSVRIFFCPECGSTVYWDADLVPGAIGVTVGAFADPFFPKPQAAVWAQHKLQWSALPEGVPEHRRTSLG